MSELKAELIDSLHEILPLSHDKKEIEKTILAVKKTAIPSSPENVKLAFDFFDCVNEFENRNPKIIKVLNAHCPHLIETLHTTQSPKHDKKRR